MRVVGRNFLWLSITSALLLGGCEKADTSHNARKVALPEEEAATPMMASVYRYNGAAQAVADMRKSVTDEKWSDALGAAEALLKEEPNHVEAQRILTQAKMEGTSQLRLADFQKRVGGKDVAGAVRAWRQIGETSVYRQRGLAEYEKLRDAWLVATEADVRAFVRTSRCEDARRGVRMTAELFPEGRASIEAIAATCRGRVDEVASRDKKDDGKDEVKKDEKPAELAMAAPRERDRDREREPLPVAAAPTPVETRTVAAEVPKPAPAVAPAPPAPKRDAKIVPLPELEKLRVAGERQPELPPNIKTIMKRDQVKQLMVASVVCVNESGSVSSVSMKKASEYDEANQKIISDIKRWKFKPYLIAGTPSPVCTPVVLSYQMNFSMVDRCKNPRYVNTCDK